MLALTAVAALGWVVKSLFEVEVRMTKIEESTEEIKVSLLKVRTSPHARRFWPRVQRETERVARPAPTAIFLFHKMFHVVCLQCVTCSVPF